jgi:hypothetical protein
MANIYSLSLTSSSSQYASISDASQTGLDITTDQSYECWVKLTTTPSSGNVFSLVNRSGGAASASSFDFFLLNSGGTLKLSLTLYSGSSSENYIVDWTPSTGTWYHVAVTWKASTSKANFYVNGSQQGTEQSGAFTSVNNATVDFAIGGRVTGAWLNSLIDEVRAWNDVRTSAEILANYNQILTGSEANLQGYWRLENNYNDTTSNSNLLTAVNAPTFSTDVPFVGPVSGGSFFMFF